MKLSTYKYVPTSTEVLHIGCAITTKSKQNLNMKMQPPKCIDSLFQDTNVKNSIRLAPATYMNLKEKWMEYQGVRNWDGLLDPLDDGLRREILRYGNFVEAAYRSSSSHATCRYHKKELLDESGLSWSGYRVTKNLVAHSSIKLPKWMERDPNLAPIQSSWIGYVAVCQDKREISRLGRRDVVIALRGTATCLEWMENLRATLTPVFDAHSNPDEDLDLSWDSRPMVESGFLSLYTSSIKNRSSLQKLMREEIERIMEKYKNEPLSFTITGHSLGAALATLAAYDIKNTFTNMPLVTVISFAGPRVGNLSFRRKLEEQGTKVLRIVNSDDFITKVPGFVVENNECYSGHYTAVAAAKFAGWVQKLVEDTQWVYADVGCELRLNSRDSPYLKGLNVATCHELQTYLHLVNGFVSSNCPFRPLPPCTKFNVPNFDEHLIT